MQDNRNQRIQELKEDIREALKIAKELVDESTEDRPFDKPPVEILSPLIFQVIFSELRSIRIFSTVAMPIIPKAEDKT